MKPGNIPNDGTYYVDKKIVTAVNEKVKIILDLFYNGLETKTLKAISQNEKDNLLIKNKFINTIRKWRSSEQRFARVIVASCSLERLASN